MREKYPDWAVSDWTDDYGNVKCSSCGKTQSPSFRACVYCCSHKELNVMRGFYESELCGVDDFSFECSACGKDFGWSPSVIIKGYKLVKVKGEK